MSTNPSDHQQEQRQRAHPHAAQILDIVLDNVLRFLPSARDRNSASLVCRSWHRADSLTRTHISIPNIYSITPSRASLRFPRTTSLLLKGRPRFSDFGLLPVSWGANFSPWLSTFPSLQRLSLKRISISDRDLHLLPLSLPSLRHILLSCCDGFSTSGLSSLASSSPFLRSLDLLDVNLNPNDDKVDLFAQFSSTSLESLILDSLVDLDLVLHSLVSLVSRCSRSLTRLRLSPNVDPSLLPCLVSLAPNLSDLGTGSLHFLPDHPLLPRDLSSAFSSLPSLRSLSGLRHASPEYLPSLYPSCPLLTSLNLSYAPISTTHFTPLIRHCGSLRSLWLLDSIADDGLQAVAATCKNLEELRVFPSDATEDTEGLVSDVGLTAVSGGCRRLKSILYFCQQMTNKAIVAVSESCRELRVFRLCIMGRHRPDYLTGEPMDEGFGAIVRNCEELTRLAVSGLLTDKAFEYIGKYGNKLRTLSVAFAGDSDVGFKSVLDGCLMLEKLEIRDCPFGDLGLLSAMDRYYNMRFLWMSSCKLTMRGCSEVSRRLPKMVVEVIEDEDADGEGKEGEGESYMRVNLLYMYRSVAGPRTDAPPFVNIL